MIATLLLVFNATVNTHTHILDDGTIVVHAHPFKTMCKTEAQDSNKADHSHKNKEFDIISMISQFLLVTTIFLFAFNILLFKREGYNLYVNIQVIKRQYHLSTSSYRGPPVF